MKHAELLTAARRVLWRTWNSSSEEIGASGAQGLLDAGMLVEPGGAAELTSYRALQLGTPEGRISAKCENSQHPVWLRNLDDVRGCPWCRLDAIEREQDEQRESERFEPDPVTGGAPVRPAGLTSDELASLPAGSYLCTCDHWDNVHGPFCMADACECGRFEHPPSVGPAPRPRGASEIKHPVMRPTRDHFAENPMPEQKTKGDAA